MTGYDRYCDHSWIRDDAITMQCVKCKARKGVSGDDA